MTHWQQVRAHYVTIFRLAQIRDGVTQQSIARRGGLKGQNAISKLLTNGRRGPSVETFLCALEGLGLDAVTFFRSLQDPTQPLVVADPAPDSYGRSHDAATPSPDAGRLVLIPVALDSRQLATLIDQRFEALATRLGYAPESVAAHLFLDGAAATQPATHRRRHRRRSRKTA